VSLAPPPTRGMALNRSVGQPQYLPIRGQISHLTLNYPTSEKQGTYAESGVMCAMKAMAPRPSLAIGGRLWRDNHFGVGP
jgi:hypothetical protein